jgi:hypothetical protein
MLPLRFRYLIRVMTTTMMMMMVVVVVGTVEIVKCSYCMIVYRSREHLYWGSNSAQSFNICLRFSVLSFVWQ